MSSQITIAPQQMQLFPTINSHTSLVLENQKKLVCYTYD
jgi:hypothetical protein